MKFLMIGPTGTGKTSLVNAITGSNLDVGHGVDAVTQQVQRARHGDDVYIDTPGIPDTEPGKGWDNLDKVLPLVDNETVVVLVINLRDLRPKVAGLMVLFTHLLRFARGAVMSVSCSCETLQLKNEVKKVEKRLAELGCFFVPPAIVLNQELLGDLKGHRLPFVEVQAPLQGPPTRADLQSYVLSMDSAGPQFDKRKAELEDEIASLVDWAEYTAAAANGASMLAQAVPQRFRFVLNGLSVGGKIVGQVLEVRKSNRERELARLRVADFPANGTGTSLWSTISNLLDNGAG